MTASVSARWFWLLGPLVIGLLTPSIIIFCIEVWVGEIRPSDSFDGILTRQFATGHNLFLLALVGLFPFVVLSGVCYLAARRMSSGRLASLGLFGLLGILGLMVPMHVTTWYPIYGPETPSSTSPIAFFFIPFYSLGSLGVGLFLGWLVSLPWRPKSPGAPATSAGTSTAEHGRKNSALIHLSQSHEARFWKVEFDELTKPEQVFRCIWDLESDVNNGGFSQYYRNASGDTAFAALDALKAIGARQAAELVRQAHAVFPNGKPPRTQQEREAQLLAASGGVVEQLEALDGQFIDYPDDLTELLYAYVMSHQEKIAGLQRG